MNMNTLVFVLYDSITNSIFDGQIAQPLLKKQQNNPQQNIIIISFEKKKKQEHYNLIINRYPTIIFIILTSSYFITPVTLYPAIKQLHALLKEYPPFTLIARGPLAGYICLRAVKKTACSHLTLQVRGLLAQEYQYAKQETTHIVRTLVYKWRVRQFKNLESRVYKKQNYTIPCNIEAVSTALQEFLIITYNTDPRVMTLASHDIPAKIPLETREQWRNEIRPLLAIAPSTKLYCYNGSIKPWQCPDQTLFYFKQEWLKNNDSFLLILTSNRIEFQSIVRQKSLEHLCKIITVGHHEIYKYLAACDIGLIFRNEHIVNWTSRPTKVLEYQAVDLPIMHNNTIAMLCRLQETGKIV